jgi:hypothetical protein
MQSAVSIDDNVVNEHLVRNFAQRSLTACALHADCGRRAGWAKGAL